MEFTCPVCALTSSDATRRKYLACEVLHSAIAFTGGFQCQKWNVAPFSDWPLQVFRSLSSDSHPKSKLQRAELSSLQARTGLLNFDQFLPGRPPSKFPHKTAKADSS